MSSCAAGALVLIGFCDSASFRSDTPWSYSLASILARAIRICSISGSVSVVGTTPATAPATADAAVAAVLGAVAATVVAAAGAVVTPGGVDGTGCVVAPVSGAGGNAAANSVVSTPG